VVLRGWPRKSVPFLPDIEGVSDAPVHVDVDESSASASTKPTRAWSDAPIRRKLIALILATSVWGVALGMVAAQFDLGVLAALGMAAGLALAAEMIGRRAIAEPVEDLVADAQRISRPERPLSSTALPRDRTDEVGQLARAIHNIAVTARRDHHEASQLRRTLDDRINKATRRATAQLSQLAMRDPLTNLANRRFLDAHGDELLNSCRLSATDVACIVVDLDNFKQINDTLGHHVGDETLKFIAELIKASIRDEDYAIRTGGDEFVILMPGCSVDRVREFTDRAAKLYREYVRTKLTKLGGLGVSFGIATMMRAGVRDADALIDAADRQLYDAKRNGKNQTAGA